MPASIRTAKSSPTFRWLIETTILFVTLMTLVLTGRSAYGAETWIQVVGIDESNYSQNYSEFYQESAQFSIACAKSPNRKCLKYIDPDTSKAKDPFEAESYGAAETKDFMGRPEKSKLLETIRKSITEAKPGDQVLLALQNHGAPDPSGEATSCLYLSASEKLCETELEELVKLAKPGVKVSVVADGCFSGGFASLSNNCIVTTADQYRVGYASTLNLWSLITEGKAKKLSDLRSLRSGGKTVAKLGSDIRSEGQCQLLRYRIARDPSITATNLRDIERMMSDFKYIDDRCQEGVARHQLSDLEDLSAFVARRNLGDLADRICQLEVQTTAETEVCSKLKTAVSAPGNRLDAVVAMQLMTRYKEAERAYQDAMDLRPPALPIKEIAKRIYLHRAAPKTYNKPKLSKVSAIQMKMIEVEVKKMKQTWDALQAVEAEMSQRFTLMAKRDGVHGAEVDFVLSCLLDRGDKDGFWEKIARRKPKLFFDDALIDEAKKCEADFTL